MNYTGEEPRNNPSRNRNSLRKGEQTMWLEYSREWKREIRELSGNQIMNATLGLRKKLNFNPSTTGGHLKVEQIGG